jgi:hypothetical protein
VASSSNRFAHNGLEGKSAGKVRPCCGTRIATLGQTRVDLQHLLEDLRDAYPDSLEETILTEIVANSLDSDATRISFLTDPAQAALVAIDDGKGMTRRELARYHDIASSGKTRGEGIGFAGVGIKLGLLLCDEVLTESRRKDVHVATRWRLAARQRAPWKWVEPRGLLQGHGTAVCLKLANSLSPLLDASFIEAALRDHFEPLLDPRFDPVLEPRYSKGVELSVNGRKLPKAEKDAGGERVPIAIHLPRKRKPAGSGYLERTTEPLPERNRGVAVATLGKVIRRGWDWLGLVPAHTDRTRGLIEIPALAESLTLNKADFLRAGTRGIAYLAYRKAVQQAVASQLQAWGEGQDDADAAQRRAARPLERDLESVLVELAEEFPALSPLVEQRAGGQKRLPTSQPPDGRSEADGGFAVADSPNIEDEHAEEPAMGESEPPSTVPDVGGPRGPKRPVRYGLSIQFEERGDGDELGRLVGTTAFVNTAHPAYRRAAASRSEGYHIALAVAMALCPHAVEPAGAHGFVAAFLRRWGEALSRDRRRRGAK